MTVSFTCRECWKLEGPLLDAAVAMAEGHRGLTFNTRFQDWRSLTEDGELSPIVSWSTQWDCGGPIIEREQIKLVPQKIGHASERWYAVIEFHHPDADEDGAYEGPTGIGHYTGFNAFGPTALIAAMRAYVTSKASDREAEYEFQFGG